MAGACGSKNFSTHFLVHRGKKREIFDTWVQEEQCVGASRDLLHCFDPFYLDRFGRETSKGGRLKGIWSGNKVWLCIAAETGGKGGKWCGFWYLRVRIIPSRYNLQNYIILTNASLISAAVTVYA